MDGINKDNILSRFQVGKKGVPRTPREFELERAAKLLHCTIGEICGKTRHFPKDEDAFVRRLRALTDEAMTGKRPPGLWNYLITKGKYAK